MGTRFFKFLADEGNQRVSCQLDSAVVCMVGLFQSVHYVYEVQQIKIIGEYDGYVLEELFLLDFDSFIVVGCWSKWLSNKMFVLQDHSAVHVSTTGERT